MSDLHLVLAPDSFKGSLSATAAAHAIAEGLHRYRPQLRLSLAPLADGGEGMLDCIAMACPGRMVHTPVTAIHGESIDARWYRSDRGEAFIESAEVLGLPLIKGRAYHLPLVDRGSAALGHLIRAALDDDDLHTIAVGLGGSACNDGGLGLLLALGATARTADGRPVAPTLGGLLSLDTLDLAGLDPRLAERHIRILHDVDNPLLGAHGATRVYGPQKGLAPDAIDAVEAAFRRWAAHCCDADTGDAARPGSGAAGGLGFALSRAGGALVAGAETLIAVTGLPARFGDADLVITGEGRSDRQTLSGKLPLAVARAAGTTPSLLLSGDIDSEARRALDEYFVACRSLVEIAGSTDAALAEPEHWLRVAAASIARELDTIVGGAAF